MAVGVDCRSGKAVAWTNSKVEIFSIEQKDVASAFGERQREASGGVITLQCSGYEAHLKTILYTPIYLSEEFSKPKV